MAAPQVFAVTEAVPTAGAIVWWRLSGEADAEEFERAWQHACLHNVLGDAPQSPTAAAALRRAVNEQRGAGVLVHPLGKGQGFALVQVRNVQQPQELDFAVATKCMLDAVGRLTIESPWSSLTTNEQAELTDTRAAIREAFEKHQTTLSGTDFSGWLTSVMPKLDAVALRDTGGIYFVPSGHVPTLNAMCDALHATTNHRVHRVPALCSTDAVDAILDAVASEAAAEASAMQKDIAADALGPKGFANRIERCDVVEAKVARYEALLGKRLDDMRERLDELRAQLTVAVVTAEQREAAASNGAQMSLADV